MPKKIKVLFAILLAVVLVVETPNWVGLSREVKAADTTYSISATGGYQGVASIYVNGVEKITNEYPSATVSAGDIIKLIINNANFRAWHVETSVYYSDLDCTVRTLCTDLLSDEQRRSTEITFTMPEYNLNFGVITSGGENAYSLVTVEGTDIQDYKAYDGEEIRWYMPNESVPNDKVLRGFTINGELAGQGVISGNGNGTTVKYYYSYFMPYDGDGTKKYVIAPVIATPYTELDFDGEDYLNRTFSGGESILITVAEVQNSVTVNMKQKTSGWYEAATIATKTEELITFPGTGTWIAAGNSAQGYIDFYEATPITFGSADYPSVAVYAEEVGQGFSSAYAANDLPFHLKASKEASPGDTSEIWGWHGPSSGDISFNDICRQQELDMAEFTIAYQPNSDAMDMEAINYRVQGADTAERLNVYAIVAPVTTLADSEIGNVISGNTRMILYAIGEGAESYAIFGDVRIPLETAASPMYGRNAITTPATTGEEYGWIYCGKDAAGNFLFEEEKPLYTVTVDGVELGSFSEGETVTLKPVSTAYKQFMSWKVTSGGAAIAGNQFTMPANAVVIDGEYDIYASSFGVGVALRLAKGVPYNFGSGRYRVSGDVTTYMGGMTFYVSSAGEYTFTEE